MKNAVSKAPKNLFEQRKSAIQLHQEGKAIKEIAFETGLSSNAVRTAIKLYDPDDETSLKPKRGKTKGEGRRLSPEQEREVFATVCQFTPQHYADKHDGSLTLNKRDHFWCRKYVKEIIKNHYAIDLCDNTVAHYIKNWGLSNITPTENPSNGKAITYVQDYLSQTKSELDSLIKEHSSILWVKRKILSNIPIDNAIKKGSVIMITNRKGEQKWWVCVGLFDYKAQRLLLTHLTQSQRNVYLIVPDEKFINREKLQAYLERNKRKLNVLYNVDE